jgi:hypothetical protein
MMPGLPSEAARDGDEGGCGVPGKKSGAFVEPLPVKIGLGLGLDGCPLSSGCETRGELLPGRRDGCPLSSGCVARGGLLLGRRVAAASRRCEGGCDKVMWRPPRSAAVDVSGSSSSVDCEEDSVGEREGGPPVEPAELVVDVMPRRERTCARGALDGRSLGLATEDSRYCELFSSSSSSSSSPSGSPYVSSSLDRRTPFDAAFFFTEGSVTISMLGRP